MAKRPRDYSQINWDDLRLFLAVAECKSLRLAAKRLNLHHSTVARRVEKLESTLKHRLFEETQTGLAICELSKEGLDLKFKTEKIRDIITGITAE